MGGYFCGGDVSPPQPGGVSGSLRLGWRVLGVLGPLEAELAGDLLSE